MFAQDNVVGFAHVKRATFLYTVPLNIEAAEVTGYATYATFYEGGG